MKYEIGADIRDFLFGVIGLGGVLLFKAGTFNYWRAWVLPVVINVAVIAQGVALAITDPTLLEGRKQVTPATEPTRQRITIVVGLASTFGIAGIPLALGSWWGHTFRGPITFMLAGRILDKEELLKPDLPGYLDYMQTVRYRLAPYLW